MLIVHPRRKRCVSKAILTCGCPCRHAVKEFRIAVKEDNGKDRDEPQPIDLGNIGAIAGNTPK